MQLDKIVLPSKETFPKLHNIQWQIIRRMSLMSESRFNQIKPKTMDPRRFTYHLNKLKELELIRHDSNKGVYLLTDRAKLLIGYFTDIPSWGNLPLHSAILLYIKKGKKILVVKRDRQPFLGYVGLPYFYTEQDEFVHQSAQNSLKLLGLDGKLKLELIIEVLFKDKQSKVIRHAFMLTYCCQNPKGEVKKRSYEGKLFWMKPTELLKVKLGYDNSRDIVEFFAKKRIRTENTIISKIYHASM